MNSKTAALALFLLHWSWPVLALETVKVDQLAFQ